MGHARETIETNVVAVRTFSKAWGLPGLRVGYAVGDARILDWMRVAGGPYSVARPSLTLVLQHLQQHEQRMRSYVAHVQHERVQIQRVLEALGARVLPSQANFVLAFFRDGLWVHDGLAGLGIGTRMFPKDPSLHNALRLTCPVDVRALGRLQASLYAVLRPQALLFDLDGVLADVSSSYREAIRQTALLYGVHVSPYDIAQAKALGNANNDWLLTHRLLEQRGVHVALDEVTRCFESLYQGANGKPGLRATETLLCDPRWLAALAKRMPLGIVTGRPRSDAQMFLQHAGVLQHFHTLVCMEDAPLKPEPGPVRMALERLGVQAAWMVGDTVDDIRSAGFKNLDVQAVTPMN
jgi:HAD superfamily hydrolase (TIGR01548 family)